MWNSGKEIDPKSIERIEIHNSIVYKYIKDQNGEIKVVYNHERHIEDVFSSKLFNLYGQVEFTTYGFSSEVIKCLIKRISNTVGIKSITINIANNASFSSKNLERLFKTVFNKPCFFKLIIKSDYKIFDNGPIHFLTQPIRTSYGKIDQVISDYSNFWPLVLIDIKTSNFTFCNFENAEEKLSLTRDLLRDVELICETLKSSNKLDYTPSEEIIAKCWHIAFLDHFLQSVNLDKFADDSEIIKIHTMASTCLNHNDTTFVENYKNLSIHYRYQLTMFLSNAPVIQLSSEIDMGDFEMLRTSFARMLEIDDKRHRSFDCFHWG